MKQDREHGKKKLATKILSFILALAFVFSIFSGTVSAKCVLKNEEVLSEKFVPTAKPVVTEKQWQITSITCEQANWKGTITTETKGNIEKTVKRTYECCCNVTGCADEEKTVTEKTPHTKKETKIETATTKATCPKPKNCKTKEQVKAAREKEERLCREAEITKKATAWFGILLITAPFVGPIGLLIGTLAGITGLVAAQEAALDEAACEEAKEGCDHLLELPLCGDPNPKPVNVPDC
jgi:uncharacterized membrane protein